MHKVVKEIIGSSRGGFNRVVVRIHHGIVQQVDKIRASMNIALTKKPRDFETADIPHFVERIFGRHVPKQAEERPGPIEPITL